jgi:glc operon protein GlcG
MSASANTHSANTHNVSRRNFMLTAAVAGSALGIAGAMSSSSQAQPYGPSVNLEQAKKLMVAGQAEAAKNSWAMAIAVVDTHGFLVAFEKMDNTHIASVQVAVDKAVSAATFRRPTKAFQDGIAGGGAGLRLLNLRGASLLDGGLPIVVDGKVVGGIGVSGATGEQDAQVAKAALSALG